MKPFPLYMVALTAAFVVLDATGKIQWSWWQVTLPLLAGITALLIAALLTATENTKDKDNR